ncbi:MAG: DUF6266 family protein [Bacteroidales bacterium]|nr:DUF6266 family protein [Bacteroidales bacterium]
MGKIRKGILGGFSGKVGTVVGASWRGIAYMRSLPLKVRNPRTQPQLEQRSKFALTLDFLKPITGLLRIGWKLYSHKQSPFNAAISYTIANAITGSYPSYAINPSKVMISRGALSPAVDAAATAASSGGSIYFDWVDNSGSSTAKVTDKALVAVINPTKSEAVFDTAGATRTDASQSVNTPANWVGDTVHAYMGFISEDGKDVANSVYLGTVTVT